jgi:hypothetical protein
MGKRISKEVAAGRAGTIGVTSLPFRRQPTPPCAAVPLHLTPMYFVLIPQYCERNGEFRLYRFVGARLKCHSARKVEMTPPGGGHTRVKRHHSPPLGEGEGVKG